MAQQKMMQEEVGLFEKKVSVIKKLIGEGVQNEKQLAALKPMDIMTMKSLETKEEMLIACEIQQNRKDLYWYLAGVVDENIKAEEEPKISQLKMET